MGNETFADFIRFTIKVILVHLVTYIVFGLVMSNLLNYEELFQQEVIKDFMLPLGSRSLLGVLFQPVRGLLFAVALWPIRSAILRTRYGWLRLWSIFVVFGILSTASAAPSSIEGVLYSRLPLGYHLVGLPEIALQTLAFSYLLVWWDSRQSIQTGVQLGGRQGFLSELLMAVVVGCFAYIGYAISSLAVFFLSSSDLSFDAAAGDVRTHLMFVVAFVGNVVYVLLVTRKWRRYEISLWLVGALAWALDGLVLFFYQWLVFGGSSLMVTMLIGLLPAGIIALSIRQNYKRPPVS